MAGPFYGKVTLGLQEGITLIPRKDAVSLYRPLSATAVPIGTVSGLPACLPNLGPSPVGVNLLTEFRTVPDC